MTELAWVFGLGMALAAGLWLAIGSRKSKGLDPAERRRLNARTLRADLDELEQQHDRGALSEDDYNQARELLGTAAESDLQAGRAWRDGGLGATGKWVLAGLPVLLTAVFFVVSDGAQHFAERGSEQAQQQGSIEDMVSGLAARLEQQPDDLRGWAMLGRSYQVLERYQDAAQAYARANALSDSQNPELLIAEAEVRGLASGQNLQGRPSELIDAALELNPHHVRALWYAMIAATQRGDGQARHDYLQRLAAEPELPQELAELLRDEFGIQPVALAGETAPQGPVIPVQVDLADGVREKIAAGATLFVYAKARQGPPMPLAVHRQPVGQWPVKVRLDDSMSMMPSMKLSSFEAWTLVARISSSGQAQPQSGDWMASLDLDQVPQQTIELTIAEQIP